jgi:hypothetical protein
MQAMLIHSNLMLLRRRDESGGCGAFGCLLFLLAVGVVIYFVMKGRRDNAEQLGASKRPLGSGPVQGQTFANPFPKCPNCAAAGDKMKQSWDGLRKVTWTCGYCGNVQIQELKDEELPLSARQRMGLDGGQPMMPGQPGYYPQQGGGGVGGLLTGMMLGSMLGGSHHDHHDNDGWGGGDSGSSGGDWGDGGGSSSGGDWGDSGGDSGGDWGGGGDSGGSDW